jgi:hypothetical protein
MFAISLSSCSRYNANFNWTNQCPLFMTVRHIFEISEDDHPRTVTHARDIWWTLDFPNAFVSPGVNSRGELVPSHGALRRRLGDYWPLVSISGTKTKTFDPYNFCRVLFGTLGKYFLSIEPWPSSNVYLFVPFSKGRVSRASLWYFASLYQD